MLPEQQYGTLLVSDGCVDQFSNEFRVLTLAHGTIGSPPASNIAKSIAAATAAGPRAGAGGGGPPGPHFASNIPCAAARSIFATFIFIRWPAMLKLGS